MISNEQNQFVIEYEHKAKDYEDVWNIEQKYLEPSTISSIEQCMKWNDKNKDIHIFIRDTVKDIIVGEITILPLSKEQFDKFMLNELEDTEINENTLLNFEPNTSCYLLFSAIAIDYRYRDNRVILSLLLTGLYNKLKYLMDNGLTFINMCEEGQTIDGQKFIENFLDLKYKRDTKEGYKLYSFDNTEDFDIWIEKFPQYINSYNEKYNLFDNLRLI